MGAIKRTVAVVVTHRAPYGRLKAVMHAIAQHPDLELKVIVGTPVSMHNFFSALLPTSPPKLFGRVSCQSKVPQPFVLQDWTTTKQLSCGRCVQQRWVLHARSVLSTFASESEATN